MPDNKVEIIVSAKDQATSVFSNLSAKLGAVAAAIAGYFGVSLFNTAIKGAADLEAGMSRVAAASDASAKEMAALKQAATDAGATTKYTATQAAAALEQLVKSGLSSKDAITALVPVLNLAQAGDIDLARSAEFVSKAVKGMGLDFSDAGRVADVLSKGANASSTSVTGLAEALSYAAPVAKAAKLSLEQTVAIMGKFADGGIDASRAGTAFNEVLSQFIDPASHFRKELANLGIVTSNFDTALRGLAAAGDKGEKAILAVGLNAGPAFRSLLNQGIGSLDDLKSKLDQAGGSAAKTAEVMQGNLKGSFNSLSSAWDTVKIALGEPVLPVLNEGVKALSAGITSAVSNGTIKSFGEAIATAFKSSIDWVTGFVKAVNFTEVAAQLKGFAALAGDYLTQAGESAKNAGNVVQLAYGVMSAGTNAVLATIYKLGEGFATVAAGVQNGLALLYEASAKITFGALSAQYKAIAAEIRLSADATAAAAQAMGDKSNQAFQKVADGASTARTAYVGISDAAAKTSVAHTTSAAAIQGVATQLQALGDKAAPAAQKQIEAATKTRESIAALKVEYEAAMAAGDIQLAAQKQQQLRGELDKTRATAKLTASELTQMFEALGITSQKQLKESADGAVRMFDILKASGQATAMDLKNAFQVVADRTLAAAGAVGSMAREMAEATLKTKAATQGLTIEFDATGKAVVRSMAESITAINGIPPAASGAAAAVAGIGQAAQIDTVQMQALADAIDKVNAKYNQSKSDRAGKYGTPGSDPTKTADGFLKNSEGAASGTFSNQVDMAAAFALVAKDKAGQLKAGDLDSAKAAVDQAKNAFDYIQARAKDSPGGVSGEAIQSTQALYNGARAALEKVEALARAGANSGYNSKAASAPAPAATSAPAAASTPAPAAAPTPAPAPTPTAPSTNNIYMVKLDFGTGQTRDINVASAKDAQTLISALQQAKAAAGY